MAESVIVPSASAGDSLSLPHGAKKQHPQKRGPPLHQIYALPAPIRTFPLPTFYPENPLSLFHIAYAWLGQLCRRPPSEPSVIHHGTWSSSTWSVHITDEKSMRALWEQGFYGKGNLSRSEPHWLQREQTRRGLLESHVSELHTDQRRVERAQAKWERARQEQEAIRQTREEEAKRAEMFRHALLAADVPSKKVPVPLSKSPVGPLELLALPNAAIERSLLDHIKPAHVHAAPTGPLELLAMPNSAVELGSHNGGDGASKDTRPPPIVVPDVVGEMKASVHMNGLTSDAEQNTSSTSSGSATPQRRKSVRFSPKSSQRLSS